MDHLRAQLGNYLEWLESRGLTGPVAYRAAAEPTENLPDQNQPDTVKAAASTPELRHEPAPVSSDTRAAAAVQASFVPAAAPAPQPAEKPAREPGKPWKFGFYSSSDLTEEEYLMVSRIALALGISADDFKIWAEDSLVHVPVDLLRCSYLVALGPGSGQTLLALGQTVAMNTVQTALQGSPILTIPHPRAMLREPALKAGAWTALQKLKALVS